MAEACYGCAQPISDEQRGIVLSVNTGAGFVHHIFDSFPCVGRYAAEEANESYGCPLDHPLCESNR